MPLEHRFVQEPNGGSRFHTFPGLPGRSRIRQEGIPGWLQQFPAILWTAPFPPIIPRMFGSQALQSFFGLGIVGSQLLTFKSTGSYSVYSPDPDWRNQVG